MSVTLKLGTMFGLSPSQRDDVDPHTNNVFFDEEKAPLLNNDDDGDDPYSYGHGLDDLSPNYDVNAPDIRGEQRYDSELHGLFIQDRPLRQVGIEVRLNGSCVVPHLRGLAICPHSNCATEKQHFNSDDHGVHIGNRELQSDGTISSQTEGGSQFSRIGLVGVAFYPNTFTGVAGVGHRDKCVDHQDRVSETSQSKHHTQSLKGARPSSGRRTRRGWRSCGIILWFRCFGNRPKQSARSHGGLESIYQICAATRNRLLSIPQFSQYTGQLETIREDQHADEPDYGLWNLLKTGIPLLVIYNTTDPAKRLLLDADERMTADSNAKRAIAMFVNGCMGELKIDTEKGFVIADLLNDNVPRFMKVLSLINAVLDIAEKR